MKANTPTYRIHPGVVRADIGTMSLAYNPLKETFFAINETASKLLLLLEQGRTEENMLRGLDAIFQESRVGAHREYVKNFVTLATENKLIEQFECEVPPFDRIKLPQVFGASQQPVFKPFDKKWILEKHPDAVYDVAFGDHWSPGSGGT